MRLFDILFVVVEMFSWRRNVYKKNEKFDVLPE